jgi:Fe-S-cluster containining protein
VVETFYVNIEFLCKQNWSINLPFLCTGCGNCCNLEDFLSAGKIDLKSEDFPDIHSEIKNLYGELGKTWELDEAKYEEYIKLNKCLFLKSNCCSIYTMRPKGCRLFPKTVFGMESKDCQPLLRFNKMHRALKRGRKTNPTYHFIEIIEPLVEHRSIELKAKLTQKQFQKCVGILRKAEMTDKELDLLKFLNDPN